MLDILHAECTIKCGQIYILVIITLIYNIFNYRGDILLLLLCVNINRKFTTYTDIEYQYSISLCTRFTSVGVTTLQGNVVPIVRIYIVCKTKTMYVYNIHTMVVP